MIAGRTSADRWATLSTLILALERCVEGAARLDAYASRPAVAHLDTFDARLRRLDARLDHEIARLTVELLTAQLAVRMRRSAA